MQQGWNFVDLWEEYVTSSCQILRMALRRWVFGGDSTILKTVGSRRRQRLFSSQQSPSYPLVSWVANEDAKVGVITLESPKTLNALTVEMGFEFQTLVGEIRSKLLEGSLSLNAMVLTGAGDVAFSAGGNFDWLRSLRDQPVHANADAMLSFYKSFLCIRSLPVPVVAAIQGPAVGAGACLALACDLRITAPGPHKLGFTFSKLGIHSGMGGSHLLQQALGSSAQVNEILLTGKSLSGEEALELGIVNKLSENVKEDAFSLAQEVATQHPLAVRSMIQTLRQQQDRGLEETLQREAYAQALCYARQDWGEGLDAVVEKRPPSFEPYASK